MTRHNRVPFTIALVSCVALVGLAMLHSSRALAQEEEAAEVAEETGDASEPPTSEIENDSVVEETHNPAEAGDSVEGAEPGEAGEAVTAAPPGAATPRKTQNASRWRQRDKQAEGTKAKKRSGKDLVIHSQYELNGRKLEVDPD